MLGQLPGCPMVGWTGAELAVLSDVLPDVCLFMKGCLECCLVGRVGNWACDED
jgi:hypothetical protein